MVKTFFKMSVTQNTPKYRDSHLLTRWSCSCSELISNVYLPLQCKWRHLNDRGAPNEQRSIKLTWPGLDGRVTSCDCARQCIQHRLYWPFWWDLMEDQTYDSGGVLQKELVLHEESRWPHLTSALGNPSCSSELVRRYRYFPRRHYCETGQVCAEQL